MSKRVVKMNGGAGQRGRRRCGKSADCSVEKTGTRDVCLRVGQHAAVVWAKTQSCPQTLVSTGQHLCPGCTSVQWKEEFVRHPFSSKIKSRIKC